MKNIEKVNKAFNEIAKKINSNILTTQKEIAWKLEIGRKIATITSRFCLSETELQETLAIIHKITKTTIFISWSNEGIKFWFMYKRK